MKSDYILQMKINQKSPTQDHTTSALDSDKIPPLHNYPRFKKFMSLVFLDLSGAFLT